MKPNNGTGKTLSRTVYRTQSRAGYRPGWVDALMAPPVLTLPGFADAILYDAAGKRIGVMDAKTRTRRMDT